MFPGSTTFGIGEPDTDFRRYDSQTFEVWGGSSVYTYTDRGQRSYRELTLDEIRKITIFEIGEIGLFPLARTQNTEYANTHRKTIQFYPDLENNTEANRLRSIWLDNINARTHTGVPFQEHILSL
jgi:hypothetical protein